MNTQTNYYDVHADKDGVFNANSGKLININRPTVDMICIEDIAAALSKICRFGGHGHSFYSVAQHSVLVAALAPEYLSREALLHDAAEAYLGDVIKPLKNLLGIAYSDIENDFMQVISRKFNLDASRLLEIKQYDKEALTIEHEYLIKCKSDQWFETMNRVNINPELWSPRMASRMYLHLFNVLFNC